MLNREFDIRVGSYCVLDRPRCCFPATHLFQSIGVNEGVAFVRPIRYPFRESLWTLKDNVLIDLRHNENWR